MTQTFECVAVKTNILAGVCQNSNNEKEENLTTDRYKFRHDQSLIVEKQLDVQ